MTIFSKNTFLSSNVIFDRLPDEAPIDVINRVGDQLDHHIRTGSLTVPDGVSYTFEGEFRNQQRAAQQLMVVLPITLLDRKSTRLNSSHVAISYAVFCLKKKKNTQ